MSVGRLLQHGSRFFGYHGAPGRRKIEDSERRGCRMPNSSFSSCATRRDLLTLIVCNQIPKPLIYASRGTKRFSCHCVARIDSINNIAKFTSVALTRSQDILHQCPLLFQLVPAFGVLAFSVWGFEPLLRLSRRLFFRRNDANWKKSRTRHLLTGYLQPVLLCAGIILICRALDPISLASESSQAVKQRLLNFVRSLSTVSAFAFCASSLIEQMQKFVTEQVPSNDSRSMGFQFFGKAIYTAMWVASISLFMELLGFSTQRWLTAGGLGTVLLTLAGREIFTNFLSSLMIHATSPFVVNDWIQTKIEGYEVSGFVEHVGWWSPTVVRGEDQEAVHIPNHKFTVSVVRNLSQKTHWRIKTHLAISHLDANKISNIVADMRKVLAKNPQIEQQRIHRRVFLDYINTENQAFMILVSCFVRTSHFEEYLCVKETVLLDLLHVIGHHRARLATPIRTIRKTYGDVDLDDIPSAETIFTRRRRALYLLDTSSRIRGDENVKGRNTAVASEEQPSKANEESAWKAAVTPLEESNMDKQKVAFKGHATINLKDGEPQSKVTEDAVPEKSSRITSKGKVESLSKGPVDGGLKSASSGRAAKEDNEQTSEQETERTHARPPPVGRPLEENIILGVALDGAKRTLPIEEELILPLENSKELSLAADTQTTTTLPDQERGTRYERGKAGP